MASNSPVTKKSKMFLLSHRGLRYKTVDRPLMKSFLVFAENSYDKETNPQGIINLGISENKLLTDIVVPKLNEGLQIKDEHCHYFHYIGTPSFRRSIAKFLEYYMKPVETINPNHIVTLNGCGTLVKCLGSAICDPGEGILIPTPYYAGFDMDLFLEPEIVRFPVHLRSKPRPETKASFELTRNDLEESLNNAKEQGITIRALLLSNPNNPLGTVYSEKQMREFMEFAEKHSLHLISDEIYMLSIFKEGCSMTSALAITGLINPERLHILWGFSKGRLLDEGHLVLNVPHPVFDFGMSGIRAAAIYSRNLDILEALDAISYFYPIPFVLQDMLENFISDYEWLDKILIPTNHTRLRECHDMVSTALQRVGVRLVQGYSGLYMWIDLRDFIHPLDFNTERSFAGSLLDCGVFINPGGTFTCAEPGWFRLVFAFDPKIVKLGVERIVKCLENIKLNHARK